MVGNFYFFAKKDSLYQLKNFPSVLKMRIAVCYEEGTRVASSIYLLYRAGFVPVY